MGSSRPSAERRPAASPASQSDVAFALQELIACWSQAHDAMARGELDAVAGLLDQADVQLAAAGDGAEDTPEERRLRQQAATTYEVLQHAMKAGLSGLREELGKHRRGKKVLRGYDRTENDAGSRVTRSV
jgi:hypothetical protein